jgi:hypothetical protein
MRAKHPGPKSKDEKEYVARKLANLHGSKRSNSAVTRSECQLPRRKIPANQAVFAMLSAKMRGYKQSQDFADYLGVPEVKLPCRRACFTEQLRQKEAYREQAEASMGRARAGLRPGAVISIDARFDHPRDATCATVSAIDTGTNKIIFSTFVERGVRGHEGNYDGPAGGMEGEGARRIGQQAGELIANHTIVAFVHDANGATGKEFRDRLHLEEIGDQNHEIKNANKWLKACKQPRLLHPTRTTPTGRPLTVGPLDDVADSLNKHARVVLWQLNFTARRRMMAGAGAWLHLRERWPFSECAEARSLLITAILKFVVVVGHCRADLRSQSLEGFHGTVADFFPKDLQHDVTREMRSNLAVVAWNEDDWVQRIAVMQP